VEFTCPNCNHTFYAPTRKGSKSEKVKEAARRNGALGGGPPKVSMDAVREVYLQKTHWTWQEFVVALKKKTGLEYSRARAFVLLKRLKAGISADGKWIMAGKIKVAPVSDKIIAEGQARTIVEGQESSDIRSSAVKKKMVRQSI
jgi:hypothetical protein